MKSSIIIKDLIEKLSYGLYEKKQAVALSLLSAVAGESIFLLGPPGVAKSMVARRLKEAFLTGSSFEYLMSRFSTPDELFGPVSISRLKDEDRYERIVDGYLPQATVVFLDEIWKAGASIQNTLLTVLNEKIYRNGTQTIQLPMKVLIAASNELPAEHEGLEALWDRFLIRYVVEGIRDKDLFVRMICAVEDDFEKLPEQLKISDEQYLAWQDGARQIAVPQSISDFIYAVRTALERDRLSSIDKRILKVPYVSDRRWKKLVRLLRASAFLNARSEVGLSDLTLMIHCLWNDPEDKDALRNLLIGLLADMIADELALGLMDDRLLAYRQEMDFHSVSSGNTPVYKVIQSFYYQLVTRSQSKRVLVYINEFQQLSNEDEPVPFILITDRYKTGAQILKRYEKEKHPHVFPKDLLPVRRVDEGIQVNGVVYALLQDTLKQGLSKQDMPLKQEMNRSETGKFVMELERRIGDEIESRRVQFENLRSETEQEIKEHLFLDDEQAALLRGAFKRVEERIYALQQNFNELNHVRTTR